MKNSDTSTREENDNGLMGFMKAFMVMGDLTDKETDFKSKVDYKQRIVFATMKAQIPQWEPPTNWNELTDEVRMERLTKIQEMV